MVRSDLSNWCLRLTAAAFGCLMIANWSSAEEKKAPWRITSITPLGFSPDAPRDASGAVIFNSPRSRAVLVLRNGKLEAIPRFLSIHIQFEKDPTRESLSGFVIKTGLGDTLGSLHQTQVGKRWLEKGKLVKREGEAILIFERERYEDNPNAVWQGVQGLVLTGLNHEEPLTGKKDPAPAVTILGDAKTGQGSKPGEGPAKIVPVHMNEQMASAALDRAKKLLEDGKTSMAKAALRGVIREHSKTKSAQEAKKLLEKLDKP